MGRNETYSVSYDPGIKGIVAVWKGYATSSTFRRGGDLMLKTVIENSAQTILVDLKEMVLISKEDQDWVVEMLFPKMIGAGIKRAAIIQPVSYFNKVAVESMTYNMEKQKVFLNFFEDSEEARKWLMTFQSRATKQKIAS